MQERVSELFFFLKNKSNLNIYIERGGLASQEQLDLQELPDDKY